MLGFVENNEKLLKAAQNGDLAVVKEMIEKHRTEVNAENYGGVTPLYLALVNEHTDVADYLTKRKGAVWPAVEMAIKKNNLPVLQWLIDGQNLNVNYQPDGNYPTALHVAAQYGRLEIAHYLVEQGAKVTACQKEMKITISPKDSEAFYVTPLDIAKRHNHKEVCAFLKSCIKKGINVVKTGKHAPIYTNLYRSGKSGAKGMVSASSKPKSRVSSKEMATKRRQQALFFVKELHLVSDDVKKLAMVGELCRILETGNQQESQVLFKEIESKIDKNVRRSLLRVVQKQR